MYRAVTLCLQLSRYKNGTDDIVAGVNGPDELLIISAEAVQCEKNSSNAVFKHVLHEWNEFIGRMRQPPINHFLGFLQQHKKSPVVTEIVFLQPSSAVHVINYDNLSCGGEMHICFTQF